MIFTVKIFCEVNGRFSPTEGSEIKREMQLYFGDLVRKSLDGRIQYTSRYNGSKYVISVLTETQVKNRLGTPLSTPNSLPTGKGD
jgi:hypothetical protein